MKKFLALVLALSMIFALAACGAAKEGDTIVGNWVGTIDLRDFIVSQVDSSVQSSLNTTATFGDYLDSLPIKITAEFKEDGNFTMKMDGSDSRDKLKDAIAAYYNAILTELLGSQPTDELIEQVLGTDMDSFAGEIADQSLQGMASQGTSSGTYKIDGNKIVYNGNEKNYETFTLSGNTLTIDVAIFGEITFTRK